MTASQSPDIAALELLVRSVRPKEAAQILGVGIATLWRYAKRPDFPAAVRFSTRVTCWKVGEILAWRDAQANAVHAPNRLQVRK
ncbi:MAG: AlpA family phage regulatory protein [Comamonadaceae bacterium]|nr:MAG: AlpA family phage regulatory protein [Comamonadaceae bacterium]